MAVVINLNVYSRPAQPTKNPEAFGLGVGVFDGYREPTSRPHVRANNYDADHGTRNKHYRRQLEHVRIPKISFCIATVANGGGLVKSRRFSHMWIHVQLYKSPICALRFLRLPQMAVDAFWAS